MSFHIEMLLSYVVSVYIINLSCLTLKAFLCSTVSLFVVSWLIQAMHKPTYTTDQSGICFANVSNKFNFCFDFINLYTERIQKLGVKILASVNQLLDAYLTFGLSQLIYFLQCCDITTKNLIMVERTIFKFIWNKKWHAKCPYRIQRQVMEEQLWKWKHQTSLLSSVQIITVVSTIFNISSSSTNFCERAAPKSWSKYTISR